MDRKILIALGAALTFILIFFIIFFILLIVTKQQKDDQDETSNTPWDLLNWSIFATGS